MKITKIQVWNFSPSFYDGPYVMSYATQDAAYGRILRVDTDNGLYGFGEIAFAPAMLAEERGQRIIDESDYLSLLIGQDFDALAAFARKVRDRGLAWRGVAFGLETAHLDLQSRQEDRSCAELLGGPVCDAVNDYFSISERSVDKIHRRLAIAGPDRAVIQLKIGIDSLEDDITQVSAALNNMNERQTLLADSNGGRSVSEACEIIALFDDPRVIWEEPCSTYDDSIIVAHKTGKPVMVDQCIGDLEKALRAAKEHVVEAICIKPAYLGGLSAARQVRDLCIVEGVRMRIDGPWCGDIAVAAILNLAIGAPSNLLIASCDLREPLDIKPDLKGVVNLGSDRIAPPSGPGLGIEIKENQLGQPEAVYQ